MRLSVCEIASACAARVVLPASSDAPITSLTWDSREVREGSLYVALPGERHDGCDFAADACAAGARCVIASHELSADQTEALARAGAALLIVDDAPSAITDLARAWRDRIGGLVIGLTGSNGKTTTKNLVRDVLSLAGSVVATKGNQNNELGVPNTLLAADEDTDFVVVEMGMRGQGQIESLCTFVRPEWGIVTQVGESHIELLGSRENIARAKSELVAALPQGGIAFLNDACDMADFVWEQAKGEAHGVSRVRFNAAALSDQAPMSGPAVWASDVSLDGEGCASFQLCASGFSQGGVEAAPCSLALKGLHNVSNACAAAAVGRAARIPLADIARVLGQAKPESGRQETLRAKGGFTVVNDAYNANPDSMRCALNTFAALSVKGRRIAVLGDMGELGDFAPAGHEEMGELVAKLSIDELVTVGELGSLIADAAERAGMPASRIARTSCADEALKTVLERVCPLDAVLVKASHSMGLERVVEGLVD